MLSGAAVRLKQIFFIALLIFWGYTLAAAAVLLYNIKKYIKFGKIQVVE